MEYLKSKKIFRVIHHTLITVPLVSSMIIPILIFDLWSEIYMKICFPLCNIKYLKRKDYIIFDRHKLEYLTPLQKIFCLYCAYGNGVMAYWKEMAAQTEKYWCGVKHKNSQEHQERLDFIDYNNKKEFMKDIKNKTKHETTK